MRAVSNLFHDRGGQPQLVLLRNLPSFVGWSVVVVVGVVVEVVVVVVVVVHCTGARLYVRFALAVCYYYYFILPSLATKKKCSTSLLIVRLIAGCGWPG